MKIYNKSEVCFFSKAKDQWGEFGNMSGGFKFRIIREVLIPSSENLYQAMRFTEFPSVQKEIMEQKSGMGAKMLSKKYKNEYTSKEFEDNKVSIMKWCLQLKFLNHKSLRDLLLLTGDKPIVELSTKDQFWGTKVVGDTLVGENVLGLLLMELRDNYKKDLDEGTNNFKLVVPPLIENFKFYGNPAPIIDLRGI